MRRADRLFQIIQILRRSQQPVTGSMLACELEVSLRTLYRDIADLIGQRVPIRGEAGLGYVLDRDFDMPPLMLTPTEIEAAVLGAQWVAGRGDPTLADAARDLVAKIEAIVPDHLRPFIAEPSIGVPLGNQIPPDGLDMARTRQWIRDGRKIHIEYCDEQGQTSARTIWPVMIGYADTVRLLAAWCELRQDFRHFRTDRILAAEFLDTGYGARRAQLRTRWRNHLAERHATRSKTSFCENGQGYSALALSPIRKAPARP